MTVIRVRQTVRSAEPVHQQQIAADTIVAGDERVAFVWRNDEADRDRDEIELGHLADGAFGEAQPLQRDRRLTLDGIGDKPEAAPGRREHPIRTSSETTTLTSLPSGRARWMNSGGVSVW